MFGRRTKWISVLLLMAFVIGIGTSVLACADDDHSSNPDAAQHCVMHCGCHTWAVTPSSTNPAWSPPLSYWVMSDTPLKLPLFAAAIFQPPKL
jgi:hypothetical protein